ncbi:MAG: hypothetical protein AAGB29_09650 [Planctomycetota bacterium]
MNAPHLSRYQRLIAHLAGQALDLAEPHVDPAEPGSLAIGLPAARAMLAASDEQAVAMGETASDAWRALADSRGELRDALGHTRPTYYALVLAMTWATWAPANHKSVDVETMERAEQTLDARDEIELRLLSTRATGDAGQVTDAMIAGADDGAMHPYVDGQELIDVWWYRELVAIHALGALALSSQPDRRLLTRLQRAVMYHLENTQPDHTTAQPWGVAAFAFFPEAIPFADQQLHDAQANWTTAGPASALLPGLILADAAHTLARVTQLDPTPA